MAFSKKKPVKGKKKPVKGKKVAPKGKVDWSKFAFPKGATPKKKPKGG